MKTLRKRFAQSGWWAIALTSALAMTAVNPAHSENVNVRSIEVQAKPIKSFVSVGFNRERFGKLKFVGGLHLQSSDKDFGGLSGLRLLSDRSRMIAVSDAGDWFIGQIERKGERPIAVKDAKVTPILSRSGKPHGSKTNADAEGVALRGNTAYVSFERNHRVEAYTIDKNGLAGKARSTGFTFSEFGMTRNKGLEGIAVGPATSPSAGLIIMPAERLVDDKGNLGLFRWDGKKKSLMTVVRVNEFDITDADFLPNGDLVLLERQFNPPFSVSMRIRRIGAASLRENNPLKGEELIRAGLTYNIDNMEGLSVTTGKDGETYLSLISDDNFNRRVQRTLYLEFELID